MLNITGVFKLISVKNNGVTKNGRKYAHILAVDFFDQPTQEERDNGAKCQFYMIKAFGEKAEFLLKNFNDSNGTRRAFISGSIELGSYTSKQKVTQRIRYNGVEGNCTFDVDVVKTSVDIIVSDVRFLDKPNAKVSTADFKPDNTAEAVVDFEPVGESKPAGEHANVVDSNDGMPRPEDDDLAIREK